MGLFSSLFGGGSSSSSNTTTNTTNNNTDERIGASDSATVTSHKVDASGNVSIEDLSGEVAIAALASMYDVANRNIDMTENFASEARAQAKDIYDQAKSAEERLGTKAYIPLMIVSALAATVFIFGGKKKR